MNFKEGLKHFAGMTALLFLSTSLLLFPILFLCCWYSPVINVTVRYATILFGLLSLCGLLFAIRKTRWQFRTALGLLVLAVLFLALPASPPNNRDGLRTAYAEAMQSYLGCPYMWGGEGRFGIDCSGLVRRGMEDALVQQGLLHLNPFLVRQGLSLWWHDTTAREIGRGYVGRTHIVTNCRSLNELDHSLLRPGDMAVTTSGVHVMGYIGNKTWIAADPDAEKVVTFTIPEKDNAYFLSPMNIVRWRILEDQ